MWYQLSTDGSNYYVFPEANYRVITGRDNFSQLTHWKYTTNLSTGGIALLGQDYSPATIMYTVEYIRDFFRLVVENKTKD